MTQDWAITSCVLAFMITIGFIGVIGYLSDIYDLLRKQGDKK